MRSLYISLSQRSSITIILIPKFRLLQLGIQMENYEDLSNIEHYSSPASFTNLLTIMRVCDNEHSHLTSDGFTTLREIVEYFEQSSGSQIRTPLQIGEFTSLPKPSSSFQASFGIIRIAYIPSTLFLLLY